MSAEPTKNLDGMTMGARLKWLRLVHGMSRKDVAKYMHVSVSAVGYWELNHDCPTVYKIFQLADFYGVDARCLAEGFPASHPLRIGVKPFADENVTPITRAGTNSKLELSGSIVKPKKQRSVPGGINVKSESRSNQPRSVAAKKSTKTKQHK
jgi:transcriptional regulator with XRE-family HTH domain